MEGDSKNRGRTEEIERENRTIERENQNSVHSTSNSLINPAYL